MKKLQLRLRKLDKELKTLDKEQQLRLQLREQSWSNKSSSDKNKKQIKDNTKLNKKSKLEKMLLKLQEISRTNIKKRTELEPEKIKHLLHNKQLMKLQNK